MCGSTHISSMYEPEEYSALLDALRIKFAAIIDAHNGTLLRVDGDGFLIAFGHPIMFENATQNAIHTALEIHAAVEKFNREKNGFAFYTVSFFSPFHCFSLYWTSNVKCLEKKRRLC